MSENDPNKKLDDLFDEDEEYDPLVVDDFEIDQEDMDDDNPEDTVDYPTLRNMPKHMQREAVYTPERQGGAEKALFSLIDYNPGRRQVLLAIIGWCSGNGCGSKELSEKVTALQEDNYSVYEPMTLCRMLERAGGLELEMPAVTDEHENVEEGVAYLTIKDDVDPVWHATDAALEVYDELTHGASFRDIVLDRDSKYAEVYLSVLELIAHQPQKKQAIDDLVDTYEIVKHPRRFGGHFVDMLEKTDVITWKDHAWTITELGQKMLPELRDFVKEA